jgi:2-keto-4-pentenoate hydratase
MKLAAALLLTGALFAAEVKLGKPLELKEPVPISELTASPDAYLDKTVQVKGKVTEVCQMMGCWMALADPATGKSIRIKVEDGEIVFPKDAPGKTAIAEGKLVKLSLTRDQAIAQARHEAEEQGRKFDPKSVKGPSVTYQIQGRGAVLMD